MTTASPKKSLRSSSLRQPGTYVLIVLHVRSEGFVLCLCKHRQKQSPILNCLSRANTVTTAFPSCTNTASASSRTEYVNIGTPEETVLETYFVMLSKFNFYRAREQCVSWQQVPSQEDHLPRSQPSVAIDN